MVYYILLSVTLVLFVLLHVFIFPSMFLRSKGMPCGDRGIRDINETGNSRTIIYRPGAAYCGVIKHYLISSRGGKMQLKCEVDKSLKYIDYDIRMFNIKGRMFKTLNVREAPDGSGYTKTITLDRRTAYTNVVINRADGEKFPVAKTHKLSAGGVFMYFLCSILTEIVSVFIIKLCISEIYGDIYRESFIFSLDSTLVTIAVCAVLIVLNVIITCVSLRKYTRGKPSWRRKNA